MKRLIFLTVLAIGISVFVISCSNSPPPQFSTIDTLYTKVNNTEANTYTPSKADAYNVAKTIIDTAIFAYIEDLHSYESPVVRVSVHHMDMLTITQIDKNTFTVHGAVQARYVYYKTGPAIWTNGHFSVITNFSITVTYLGKNNTSDKNMWIKNSLKFDFYPTSNQKMARTILTWFVVIFLLAMFSLLFIPFLGFILHRE